MFSLARLVRPLLRQSRPFLALSRNRMERYRGNTKVKSAVNSNGLNNSAAVMAPSRTAPIHCRAGEPPALGTISGSSGRNVTWTNMHDYEYLEIRAQLCSCWTTPVPTSQFLTLTNGSGILSVTSFSHACLVVPTPRVCVFSRSQFNSLYGTEEVKRDTKSLD